MTPSVEQRAAWRAAALEVIGETDAGDTWGYYMDFDPRDLLALLDALDIAEQGRRWDAAMHGECCASGRCEVCDPSFKWS
jgi:hypothetical protein